MVKNPEPFSNEPEIISIPSKLVPADRKPKLKEKNSQKVTLRLLATLKV
jgi:hypothetical protein